MCCQQTSKMNRHVCSLLLAILALVGGAWTALAHDTLGRGQAIVAVYQPTTRLHPDPAELDYHRGVAYGKRGHWQDAVAAFQEGIRLKPDYAEAHSGLGEAYGKLGRLPDAVAALQQATRLQPKDAQAHYNLGVTYLMLGDQGSAREEYKMLKPLDQDLATALLRSLNNES